MKKISVILAVIVIVLGILVMFLGIHGMITKNYAAVPYTRLFTGLMFLFFGALLFRENRKGIGVVLFIAAGFSLFGSITVFL
ncbi:hypothetical protein [Sporosarcina sp. NPDC096371]|uniref:hypothetical protein n=1 Tax=Sporosarcina sp. NPDC096371 TaxID=3364530 RepID=UPI0037FEBBED